MSLIVDKYECRGCGPNTPPCQVIIPHSDSKLPKRLRKMDKFRKRICICDNQPDVMADWQKVDELTQFEPNVE